MVRLNPRSLRVLNQDGAADAIHSVEGVDHVGAFLREARETTGRSVGDVAQILRIRRVYLEAIEDGRFDELPGAAYAVGFIRSYATYLRLDVPTLVARFKEEASGIEAQQDLDFPTPVPEGRFPGGMLVTLCLVVAAAGLGGWYWWQSQNTIEITRVPPPPEVLTGSTDTPVAAVVETAPSVTENADIETPQAAEVEPVVAAQEPPAPVVEDVQVAETPEPEPVAVAEIMQPVETMAAPVIAQNDVPAVSPEPTQSLSADAENTSVAPVTPEPELSDAPATAVAAVVDEVTPEPVPEAIETPEPVTPAPSVEPAPAETSTEQAVVVVPNTPAAPNSDLNVGVALPPEPDNDATQAVATSSQTTSIPSIPGVPGAPVAANPTSDGRTYGTVNRNARIILSAREPDTWVQVMDSQQNALLTQMLRPGDRYLVPDRPGLSLQTNNAGGLDILVDGAAVPAIGGRGDIRRDVRLDPESLKSGTAVIR